MYVLYEVSACVGACVGCSFVDASVANLLFLSRQAGAQCDQLSLAQVFHIITFRKIDKLLLVTRAMITASSTLGCSVVFDFSSLRPLLQQALQDDLFIYQERPADANRLLVRNKLHNVVSNTCITRTGCS